MRIVTHWNYTVTGYQRFIVPEGVTTLRLECWGAAGGMASDMAFEGAKNVLVGKSAPVNNYFTNDPAQSAQLGVSYGNNSGYVAGDLAVTPGQTLYIAVGGNGGPGYTAVKLDANGTTHHFGATGGNGGWNGGGDGGDGAQVFRNLYNSTTTTVQFTSAGVPNGPASVGNLWLDTTNHVVRKCVTAYTSGNGTLAKWGGSGNGISVDHTYGAGAAGGGGGGATDIRLGSEDPSARIMVAGGSGGTGGSWNKTSGAPSAWSLLACPTTPQPPFGTDTAATGATDTANRVWASRISYLTGGWGTAGMGGSTSASSGGAPTTNGGISTNGGGGGQATGRHSTTGAPVPIAGSGGTGGTNLAPGQQGAGAGSGGSAGSGGNGGRGSDAAGGFDDFCSGGGGGGGGWFGGGGGGQGFINYGASGGSTGATTHGGGGGGGSNYVSSSFTNPVLLGCARPPASAPGYTTSSIGGASGVGGFARCTFHLLPTATWTSVPTAAMAATAFPTTFSYTPARDDGTAPGVAYYVVGTSTTVTDTFPTTTTTINVTDKTLTSFTRNFTAPAAGSSIAIFVKVVDLDGDSSPWAKQIVLGSTTATVTPGTITAPASGATVSGATTVTWSVGTQTPEAAYKLALTGNDPVTNSPVVGYQSNWRRGGSRVNFATDPGFAATTNAVWSSLHNANLVGNDASFPGVSGKNGKISWTATTSINADNHTTPFNNLVAGTQYRLHLGVASALANDSRPVSVAVSDASGLLDAVHVDLSANAAGTYGIVDLAFTPRAQGVFVSVAPYSSATGNYYDADAGTITYLKDFMIELVTEQDAAGYQTYFDGGHANGNPGTASWSGTANASGSFLTGTDVTSGTLTYAGAPLAAGLLTLTTLSEAALLAGFAGASATQPVRLNPTTPGTPSSGIVIDSANGLIHITCNAADGAVSNKTVSFDIFRNGVRIVTGLLPDQTTRIATYDDTPAHGVPATYVIRAYDSSGGYIDQTDGTVSGS